VTFSVIGAPIHLVYCMKATNGILNQVIHFLLILLWVYAALVKLFDFEAARGEMLNQVFPDHIALLLAWLIPGIELTTAVLIFVPKTTFWGYWCSFVLLFSFTLYILFGLFNFYQRMPCSCGGIIATLSWGQHLAFNLFFLALTIIAIIIYQKERNRKANMIS
jgi:putative oxidoreductase